MWASSKSSKDEQQLDANEFLRHRYWLQQQQQQTSLHRQLRMLYVPAEPRDMGRLAMVKSKATGFTGKSMVSVKACPSSKINADAKKYRAFEIDESMTGEYDSATEILYLTSSMQRRRFGFLSDPEYALTGGSNGNVARFILRNINGIDLAKTDEAQAVMLKTEGTTKWDENDERRTFIPMSDSAKKGKEWQLVQRLSREDFKCHTVRAIAVQHPHLSLIAMEHFDGDLEKWQRDVIADKTTSAAERLAAWVPSILNQVAIIVHCITNPKNWQILDLKPENILYRCNAAGDDAMELVLGDLGSIVHKDDADRKLPFALETVSIDVMKTEGDAKFSEPSLIYTLAMLYMDLRYGGFKDGIEIQTEFKRVIQDRRLDRAAFLKRSAAFLELAKNAKDKYHTILTRMLEEEPGKRPKLNDVISEFSPASAAKLAKAGASGLLSLAAVGASAAASGASAAAGGAWWLAKLGATAAYDAAVSISSGGSGSKFQLDSTKTLQNITQAGKSSLPTTSSDQLFTSSKLLKENADVGTRFDEILNKVEVWNTKEDLMKLVKRMEVYKGVDTTDYEKGAVLFLTFPKNDYLLLMIHDDDDAKTSTPLVWTPAEPKSGWASIDDNNYVAVIAVRIAQYWFKKNRADWNIGSVVWMREIPNSNVADASKVAMPAAPASKTQKRKGRKPNNDGINLGNILTEPRRK